MSVIVLNWNGWKDTLECLESLSRTSYPNFDTIVVDNGSSDDSVDMIQRYCENAPRATLIRNSTNCGFAEGNNIGIRHALAEFSPEYVLLLNNDTSVEPGFLKEMIETISRGSRIGSVQSVLIRKDSPDKIDSLGQTMSYHGAIRDAWIDEGVENLPSHDVEIFGPCAAAALYRSSVLREVGLFSSDFFIGYEDVDLSWRTRLAGYESFLAAKAVVYHMRGDIRKPEPVSFVRSYHGNKNAITIWLRYYPRRAVVGLVWREAYRFLLFLAHSAQAGDIGAFPRTILSSLASRKAIQSNPNIREIQKRWLTR